MTLFRYLALGTCTCLFSLGLVLSDGPAQAGKPGDAVVEEPDKESGDQRIEIFDNNKAESVCKVKGKGKGKVCLRAAPSTEAEGSEDAPVFKRGGGGKKGDWVLDVYGIFAKAALAGNAQFIFSDVADSNAAKHREVVGIYQSSVKAGSSVSARIRLSPEEGFRPGRQYRAHIAQIIAGKEIVLAEGVFDLK